MRIDVCIYNVKANSQAGNIRVHLMTKQKPKLQKDYAFCHTILLTGSWKSTTGVQ